MRNFFTLIPVALLAIASLCAQSADDLAKFQPMMKAGAKANGGVRSAIMGKDVAAAAKAATDMSASFDSMTAYWKEKGRDDAAKFSADASAAAKAVAAATTTEDQQEAFGKARATCGGCHAIYRDGQKDAFKPM